MDSTEDSFLEFNQMEEEPFNDFFMAMGYQSKNSILNLGQLFTILMIIAGSVFFALILKLLNLKHKSRA